MSIASLTSLSTKVLLGDLYLHNFAASAAGGGSSTGTGSNSTGLGNTTTTTTNPGSINSTGNKPGENTGSLEKPYIPTGPAKYLKEKQELNWLDPELYEQDLGEIGPLEKVLDFNNSPTPEYVWEIRQDAVISERKQIVWLEKVNNYFTAKDAGLEPSLEDIYAFISRKIRYTEHVGRKNWKGPVVDFNDPANVRKVANDDLNWARVRLDLHETIVKNEGAKKFVTSNDKAGFYKCLAPSIREHHNKYADFYKKQLKLHMDWYNSMDEKTLLNMHNVLTIQTQDNYKKLLNEWLKEKETNKDLLEKWLEDKINKDFYNKWLGNNNNT